MEKEPKESVGTGWVFSPDPRETKTSVAHRTGLGKDTRVWS